MIFDAIRSMARSTRPSDPRDNERFIQIGLPIAGTRIDHDTALSIAAVWECVLIISETLSMLPWRVFETVEEEGRKRRRLQDESTLDFLLHKRPNDEMPALFFKQAIQAHALLWGNGYAEIETARGGDIAALHLITPDFVTPKRDERGQLYYEIRDSESSTTTELAANRMFHIRGLSWNGHSGYDLVRLARETFATAKATENFTAAFFGNGAHTGGIITTPDGTNNLGEEAVKNLLASFNKRNRGARNAFRTNYLDKGLTYKEIGVNPNDAQLIEAKKFNVLDVARWFRMPPHKLAHLDDSIKANIEAQGIEFVTDTMLPWVLRWEQEADFKFFDAKDRGRQFTKMDLNALMRGDSAARGTYYKNMTSIGAFSINDVLELEDRDSIGPDGDLRLVPMNMVSLERANRDGETSVTRTRSTDAHIDVFEDAVGRMNRRESHAVQRRTKLKPDEFAAYAREFYAEHAKQMTAALLRPAMAFATFFGDGVDPEDVSDAVSAFCSTYCDARRNLVVEAHAGGHADQCFVAADEKCSDTAMEIASLIGKLIKTEQES